MAQKPREMVICPVCRGMDDPKWGHCLNCDARGVVPADSPVAVPLKKASGDFKTPEAMRLSLHRRRFAAEPWQYFVGGAVTMLLWTLFTWGIMHFLGNPLPSLRDMDEEKAVTALTAACSYIYEDEL